MQKKKLKIIYSEKWNEGWKVISRTENLKNGVRKTVTEKINSWVSVSIWRIQTTEQKNIRKVSKRNLAQSKIVENYWKHAWK